MKSILFLYRQDINRILTNWVVAVIIMGLVLLPSLYAWFNIEASWDPYGSTGGLKIAVTNLDRGTMIRAQRVNIGAEIVASLQENTQLGWTFVDQERGIHGVQHGDYYAGLVIPGDFSEKIATFLSGKPQKPTIDYYVNEKVNAIAPKITSKGVSTLVEKVSSNFVKTASEEIFKIFNRLGIQLERDLPDLEMAKSYLFHVEKSFPALIHVIKIALEDADKAAAIVERAESSLHTVFQIADRGQRMTEELGHFLMVTQQAFTTISPLVKEHLLFLRAGAVAVRQLTESIQDMAIAPEEVLPWLERAQHKLELASTVAGLLSLLLQQLDQLAGDGLLQPEIARLTEIEQRFQRQLALLQAVQAALLRGERPTAQIVDELRHQAIHTEELIVAFLNGYDRVLGPKLERLFTHVQALNQDVEDVLIAAQEKIPDVKQILRDASTGLVLGRAEIAELQAHLPALQQKVQQLANRIRQFEGATDLAQLIQFLKSDVQAESDFFAQPLELKEHQFFPIPNYGSAMSPFFSTLSLWVGTLLLVSLLRVDIQTPGGGYKNYQLFFGRFFTFLTLALLQSLIVTSGDLLLLQTYVKHPYWFILFGFFISLVFMLLVYTLVSVFGNVGKALAVILLVLQVAGSGGTFPIQVTPSFFQQLYPFLPFTYAISLMREAVGGILWDIVLQDLIVLSFYLASSLVLGLALKEPLNKAGAKLVQKAKRSQLLH